VARSKSCAACAVRSIALCQVLDQQQLAHIIRHSYARWYPAGRMIAGAAASENWCATILEGVIKLSKTLPDGRQQIVALLFPGDFLGRPFRAEFPYTAEAATDVHLCCYSRASFEGLLRDHPKFKQAFLERILDSVDAARDWMLLLGRKTAREKVATLLLTILKRSSEAGCEPNGTDVVLPLTRTEMADYLGLRLETVSRQLRQLEASGAIKRRDVCRIRVLACEKLEAAAGADGSEGLQPMSSP
jgi:CRP/FNR family transcriptional regulator, anaerobic regulatory protein